LDTPDCFRPALEPVERKLPEAVKFSIPNRSRAPQPGNCKISVCCQFPRHTYIHSAPCRAPRSRIQRGSSYRSAQSMPPQKNAGRPGLNPGGRHWSGPRFGGSFRRFPARWFKPRQAAGSLMTGRTLLRSAPIPGSESARLRRGSLRHRPAPALPRMPSRPVPGVAGGSPTLLSTTVPAGLPAGS